MLFKSYCLGIDIGTKNINTVQLIKTGRKKILNNFYQMENPIGKVDPDQETEKKAMGESLAKISKNFHHSSVVIGIPSELAIFRYVKLPLLKKKELKESISWEIHEFSSMLNREVVFDYKLLNEQKDACFVLLVAVPKDVIYDYAEIAKVSGLKLKVIDVYPLANARVLKTYYKPGVTAVIDLNPSNSEMTIVNNGKIIFMRSLDLPQVEKEFAKILHNEGPSCCNCNPKVQKFYEQLTFEITRAFNIYSLQGKNPPIKNAIFLGKNGDKIHPDKINLKKSFNVDICDENMLLENPAMENIDIGKSLTEFFSAIGFALRG